MAKKTDAAESKKTETETKGIDGRTVMKRADRAFKLKEPWDPLLREMFELTMAARNPYDPNKTGATSMSRQFDSTAPTSLFKATNRIFSEMTPADQNWIGLDIGPVLLPRMNELQQQQMRKILSQMVQVAEVVFDGGNFINAQWECFLEMLGGIMGCMLVLEDGDDIEPVSFQCVSQSEVALEIDGRGRKRGVYRKRKGVKVREITEMWDDAELPKELKDKLRTSGANQEDPEIDLMESTYWLKGGGWAYCIHWRKGSSDEPVQLVYREYNECPWIIYQWSRIPGSPYGPGPGILLLPAIRMVNKVREMVIMNAALALAGMYLGRDDGVLNIDNIQIMQGGIVPVASTGGTIGASLVPLETGRNFEIGHFVLTEEQEIIRRGLFDNGLPDPKDGVRSPTEIIERVRELAQDVGGAIGRITRQLVELVARVMGILQRRGLVPGVNIDQFTFKVQIKSPLARAQQLQEVQTILQWYQMLQSLGGPAFAAVFANIEAVAVLISTRMGIPHQVQRDTADKEAMQQQIGQIIAAQQMAQPAAANLAA
ncbi:MAG: hypothetical protein JNM12_10060 [Alphaproteobacteria bacterium]|nr:hypothetical protein [Alphaproteobacteria bacterium]